MWKLLVILVVKIKYTQVHRLFGIWHLLEEMKRGQWRILFKILMFSVTGYCIDTYLNFGRHGFFTTTPRKIHSMHWYGKFSRINEWNLNLIKCRIGWYIFMSSIVDRLIFGVIITNLLSHLLCPVAFFEIFNPLKHFIKTRTSEKKKRKKKNKNHGKKAQPLFHLSPLSL